MISFVVILLISRVSEVTISCSLWGINTNPHIIKKSLEKFGIYPMVFIQSW
jgi:hypothetical protein